MAADGRRCAAGKTRGLFSWCSWQSLGSTLLSTDVASEDFYYVVTLVPVSRADRIPRRVSVDEFDEHHMILVLTIVAGW